ncbi:MAG: inositol monophosphatase [Lautropia sp.]|jgi:myo-inositol-1(or 4)-monophosphatase|nr:MAG: inositol monophosphatase [Pseudomonadota bacterium]MBC6960435.1 inositol monophosphatase [Lautropia sp.]MCL4702428.1 inositol monophosphatase [Burkholderiaceae bacterium]MCZ2413720.1 inositol monophosphatase [Burkholderiales bacterium]MDL1908265.1 inositol monophosphatase [Betaproteobacteria bacterium PRO1]
MHPMLNVAVRAARRAGRIINRGSLDLETLAVARKQRNDFVTEVDHASEKAIIDTLLGAYPEHAILAEESGHLVKGVAAEAGQKIEHAEHVWIIDPLDGTTNFIHGLPQYGVSIALMQRGVVTQAVVYDPNRDELFTATRGAGAFLNDRRIRVSRRQKLDEALIGTGFPYRKLDQLEEYLAIFRSLTERAGGIRRPGAAALDLAYVACGRFDGFFEMGLSPWDVAAGSLLITEAGGLIGDFQGEPDYLFSERVVAGSPKVFAAMIALLRGMPPAARTQD